MCVRFLHFDDAEEKDTHAAGPSDPNEPITEAARRDLEQMELNPARIVEDDNDSLSESQDSEDGMEEGERITVPVHAMRYKTRAGRQVHASRRYPEDERIRGKWANSCRKTGQRRRGPDERTPTAPDEKKHLHLRRAYLKREPEAKAPQEGNRQEKAELEGWHRQFPLSQDTQETRDTLARYAPMHFRPGDFQGQKTEGKTGCGNPEETGSGKDSVGEPRRLTDPRG